MADSETSYLTCRRCGNAFPSWKATTYWVDDIQLPACPRCNSANVKSDPPYMPQVGVIVSWCSDIANCLVAFYDRRLPGVLQLVRRHGSFGGPETEVSGVLGPMLKDAAACAALLRRTHAALNVYSGPDGSRSPVVDRCAAVAGAFILDSTSILQSILSVSTFLGTEGGDRWDMVRGLHASLSRVFALISRYQESLEEVLRSPEAAVAGDKLIQEMFSTWPDDTPGGQTD